MVQKFDCVFVNQSSPVMMAWAGMAYKNKYKKPLFLYCMDVWPDSLTVGGVKQDGLIFKLFKFISKKVYRASDIYLSLVHHLRIIFVQQFDILEQKITYLPQYAEDLFIPDESRVK